MSKPRTTTESVFWAAEAIAAPEERARYLDQACGDDSSFRAVIEHMLLAYPRVEQFLESPANALDTVLEPRTVAPPGTIIGGQYKLLELLGTGGMGSVYMAEQTEPVKRLVAVKLIRVDLDSKTVLARFENERQALALMDHPNIAKVFDGGTIPLRISDCRLQIGKADAGDRTSNLKSEIENLQSADCPFFVMELVKGIPITTYCDQHHLTPRQRLELFVPVCHAIQHAHQKGIIHRDIKPSNILVAKFDDKPVPKVIDFGVAKAIGQPLTEQTLHTGFGTVVGTVEYMSPEQASFNQLDIDTRSDIYSLGVLLYELLTGRPPFTRQELHQAGMLEMLRVIREDEPPKPSTRITKLRTADFGLQVTEKRWFSRHTNAQSAIRNPQLQELDWIVMKALEKDRNRRYETANAFALDVQRFLRDEPIAAGPPSARYRLRKFVRRHRGPVLAASLILLALLGGMVATTLAMLEARRQKWLAIAAQNSEAARADAEAAQRRRARQAVDEMYTQVAQKWLAQQPRMEKVQREFLEKALSYYQEFAQQQGNDPVEQLAIATAYRRVGTMLQKLGQPAKGAEAQAQSIAILDKLAAEFPSVREYREELGHSHHHLGYIQMYSNQGADAERSFGRALDIYGQLVRDFGEDSPLRGSLAGSRHDLGIVLTGFLGGRRRPKEAIPAFQEAVKLYRQLIIEAPDSADWQSTLGATLSDWAMTHLFQGEVEQARPLLKEAMERQRAALKLEPRHPTYRQFLINHLAGWGDIVKEQGDHKEAVNIAREALALQDSLAVDFPSVPHYRHARSERAIDLGVMLKADDAKEAEAILRRAAADLEAMAGSFDAVPARRNLLADCYKELGLLFDATDRSHAAVAEYRAALKWAPKDTGVLSAYGMNLIKQKQFVDAEPLLRECLQIRETKEADDWTTFYAKVLLGDCLLGQKKYAAAEPFLVAGYEGMKKREDAISADEKVHLTEALERLVQLYEATGKKEEAAKWRKRLEAEMEAKKKQ